MAGAAQTAAAQHEPDANGCSRGAGVFAFAADVHPPRLIVTRPGCLANLSVGRVARALELRQKTCHESTRSRGACGGHGAPPSGGVARRSRAHVWTKQFRGNESPGMLC